MPLTKIKGSVFDTGDNNLPVNVKDFGAIGDGVTDDTDAIDATKAHCLVNGYAILLPKGDYLYSGTVYSAKGDALVLPGAFSTDVNIAQTARQNRLLLADETEDVSGLDSKYTRVPLAINVIARGSQHASGQRVNLINYSDNGGGCTGVYTTAFAVPPALWTAAFHANLFHEESISIGLDIECASYKAPTGSDGTMYGIVLHNVTATTSQDPHPYSGSSISDNPNSTALFIEGHRDVDESGAWKFGIRFDANSIKDTGDGEVIRIDTAAKYGISFNTTAVNSGADILLQGDSAVGINCNGTYTTGNAIKVAEGMGIAYEATGSIKHKYDSGTLTLGIYSGSTQRFGFAIDSTPTLSLNGTQVLQERKTGWSADTGTASRTSHATYSGTAGAGYNQATIQALMDAVTAISQAQKALKDDLIAHGLIGA